MDPVPDEPPLTWKTMGKERRIEVLQLASRGERHPDPEIAAAAADWSNGERWDRLSNRLPGWLLPGVGALEAAMALVIGLNPVFVVGGAVVVLMGCLGWMATSAARKVRRLPAVRVPSGRA